MTDFAFKIEGDASAANRAADTVLDRLEDIRRKAADASKGMSFDKLTGSFAQLGNAIRQEHQAMQRAAQIHDDLARKNQPLVQSFGGLAEAIRREHDALERIQGPLKRYQADIQALDGLLRRGAITQQQHATETAKAAVSFRASQGKPTGGIGAALGGLQGGLAAAGIGVGVSEIGAMANEFQTLQNRLRYLAGGDMEKVNQLFTQLQGIANRTRQDLSATTEGFVRMSLATKQMGLSQSETLRFTESLNKAIALSGATGAEASAGLIQLSQGLASGALRGDELRSVLEQLPAVADVIASGLGVTRGELRKMGEDGKITAQVIVDAFKKAGTSLDKDFGNTVPTLSQSWTLFKNEMTVTVGELDKTLGISSTLGKALGDVVGVVKGAVGAFKELAPAIQAVGSAFEYINPLGWGRRLGSLVGAWDSVTGGVVRAMEAEETYAKRRYEYVLAIAQGADAVNKWHKEQVELNLRLQFGAEVADAFAKAASPVAPVATANAEAMAKWVKVAKEMPDLGKEIDEQLNKAARIAIELENEAARAAEKHKKELDGQLKLARAIGLISTPAPKITQKEQFDLYQKDLERMVQEEIDAENRAAKYAQESVEAKIKAEQEWRDAVLKATDDAAQKRMDLVKKEQEAAKQIRDAWAQGLGSIAADFVNMAAQGEISFDKLGTSLAKLALQIAAMQIGGPWGAFLGSFAGGLSLPGHATGTQFMVGGRGGSDQNIVAFRASGNERVTVETPDDVRTGRYLGGGRQVTQIVVQNDAREVVSAFGTRAGERQYARLNRKFRRN